MQDEVNEKTIALAVNVGKTGMRMTASLLKESMKKYLQSHEHTKSSRQMQKAKERQYGKRGKQTVGELMMQNQGLTNIEITANNIKSFERIANKYNIDFALKKEVEKGNTKYIVFFKARDVDVMTQAFREYSSKSMVKAKRPSLRALLSRAVEKSRTIGAEHDKDRRREKNRGREQSV